LGFDRLLVLIMRRAERHHLKENPLAQFIADWRNTLRGWGRAGSIVAVVVVLGLLGSAGYFAWQQSQADDAGELLADAILVLSGEIIRPPDEGADDAVGEDWEQPDGSFPSESARLEASLEKLLVVADGYPDLPAGITARYELATALVRLDRSEDAIEHYQNVIDRDDGGLHGAMARLGLAEVHVLEGDHEDAITLLERESTVAESLIPVDALLMRLARAYELAGQEAEARDMFSRVVHEFPLSMYSSDARRKVDTLE
jgi:hypothetical protein